MWFPKHQTDDEIVNENLTFRIVFGGPVKIDTDERVDFIQSTIHYIATILSITDASLTSSIVHPISTQTMRVLRLHDISTYGGGLSN